MDTMENTIEQELVEVPVEVESAPLEVPTSAPIVEKKKRGRKPKSTLPPPPVPVAAPNKPKKRRPVAKQSKADKMLASMLENAELDRIKCIEEMAKLMEHSSIKQARLDAIKWKIASLKGDAPLQLQGAGYSITPQIPQPPAYPMPSATPYMPPSMRASSLPEVPRANGGAIDTGLEQENEDPDQFLKVGGVIGSGGWK